jgi:hypothetical protein
VFPVQYLVGAFTLFARRCNQTVDPVRHKTNFVFMSIPLAPEHDKKHKIFDYFHFFYHRAVVKQDHYTTHVIVLFQHSFVMQPSQNSPLHCSTVYYTWMGRKKRRLKREGGRRKVGEERRNRRD